MDVKEQAAEDVPLEDEKEGQHQKLLDPKDLTSNQQVVEAPKGLRRMSYEQANIHDPKDFLSKLFSLIRPFPGKTPFPHGHP